MVISKVYWICNIFIALSGFDLRLCISEGPVMKVDFCWRFHKQLVTGVCPLCMKKWRLHQQHPARLVNVGTEKNIEIRLHYVPIDFVTIYSFNCIQFHNKLAACMPETFSTSLFLPMLIYSESIRGGARAKHGRDIDIKILFRKL